MFNYECTQLGGSVVGSCVDVFLFGACCRLPAGAKVPTMDHGIASTPAATTSGRPATTGHDGRLPQWSFQQPVADTILLHRNGSAVLNAYRPDDMSADLLANFSAAASQTHANRWQPPPQQTPVSAGDMTDVMQQYAADVHKHRRPPFVSTTANNHKITSKVDFGDGGPSSTTVKQTPSWSSSSSSPVSKSTDSVPNIRKTTPSTAAVHTTTSKQGYGDDYYDGMVLIPTLTVHDPVKSPVENNSIHHILSILNHTPPTSASNGGGDDDGHDQDQEQDPMDASPSSSSPSSPALYTWGSIEGDTKTAGYGSSSTFPATRPTTPIHPSYYPQTQHYDRPPATASVNGYYGSTPSTAGTTSNHHLPGPHFHVLSTTAKPIEPPAPTVIVLSSANDVKNPNKYSSTTTSAVYASTVSSSYRPQPSHVSPSQSIIVTGKPSVSAAYTTTATFHPQQSYQPQHQQQQQNLAFPVSSSTTLADKYYGNNNYAHQTTNNGIIHTSAKPLMSSTAAAKPSYGGHRPSAATPTTTSLPPTLSSTVYHDNNVFTTVITNHHQYNKYQPTTSGVYSTAKPVLNHDSAAVAVPSSGGYRPHVQQLDEDYPSPPAVTPTTQVFITASDVHHIHHLQQHHTSSSAYPSAGGASSAVYGDAAAAGVPFNSTDTFAFPPVRDPNANMTAAAVAAASQQEKPDAVTAAGAGDIGDGDYEADTDSNPQLTADENLDDKVHLFVEKVVQSLQGNFEDLEKVLLSGDTSTSNVTISNDDPPGATSSWPNKRPTATTTTRKPPKPTSQAGKPTKPPPPAKPVTTTYRPTPITPPLDAVPYLELTSSTAKPTKIPTLLTPVQLFQPTTYTARPPVKQPTKVTATTVVLDTFSVEHDHTTTAEPDYRKGTCIASPSILNALSA